MEAPAPIRPSPSPSYRKRKRPTSLPDELVTEILLRLPPEIVYRFRSVCPRWRVLTSTPYFVEMHYRRQSIPAILLQENAGCSGMKLSLIERCETVVRPKCIAAESWPDYHVCFSYNGLVLLEGTFPQATKKGTFLPSLKDFIIYNPVNQDTVRILTRIQLFGGEMYGMFLHPILKEYCLLWAVLQERQGRRRRPRVQWKMINLGSQPQWKEIEAGSHQPKLPPVQVNDVLYWIVRSSYIGPRTRYQTYLKCEELIMAFDMKREKFSMMPHPGPTGCKYEIHENMDLLEIDRYLSLVQYSSPDNNHSSTNINIWILTDVAERLWINSHTINLELGYPGPGTIRPIAVVNGELLLQWAFKEFYACNLQQGSIRKFGREYNGCRRALAHFKSLVSLRNCKPEIRMDNPRTRAQHAVKLFEDS